jgi:hypothetical protein
MACSRSEAVDANGLTRKLIQRKALNESDGRPVTRGFCRSKAVCYAAGVKTNDLIDEARLNPAVRKVLKRLHYPLDVILLCVRWYVAYPLSLRQA